MSSSARISSKSNRLLSEMSVMTGKSKIEIIEEALEAYRHYERMRLMNESYKKLRSNAQLWQEELEEREIWEGTIEDGLEEE